MNFQDLHPWNLSSDECIHLQMELAQKVMLRDEVSSIQTLAACDVSFDKGGDKLFAAIALLKADDLSPLEEITVKGKMSFPYIPGLLSFRELPIVLEGFAQLRTTPDIIICDGQGIAHPRRLGIASHLGLWLNIPTIGSAKKLLCGSYKDPDLDKGSRSPIYHKEELVGYALRTRAGFKPIFVSPGHLCTHDTALKVIMDFTSKYRIPDPIRHAHNLANRYRIIEKTKIKS